MNNSCLKKFYSFRWAVFLLALFFIFPQTSEAKLFRNRYLNFELPSQWKCEQEATEWICTNPFEKRSKQAIIILTAKEAGPTDSLESYKNHLKTSKTIPSKKGNPVQSKIISVNDRRISGQPWVDGMHLNSEVGSFYTRYLATVKGRLAILVTLSAHKQHYTKYTREFLQSVKTLKIVAKPSLFKKPSTGTVGIRPSAGSLMDVDIFSGAFGEGEFPNESETTGLFSTKNKKIMGFSFLIASVALVYFLRRRRKK